MPLEHDPIFRLAVSVEDGLMPMEAAVERASSPDFLKKIKKEHFKRLVDRWMASFVSGEPQTLPRALFLIASICAAKRRVQDGIYGFMAFLYASALIEEMKPKKALEFLEEARLVARKRQHSSSMFIIEPLLSQMRRIFGGTINGAKSPTFFRKARHYRSKVDADFLDQFLLGAMFEDLGEFDRAVAYFKAARIAARRATFHKPLEISCDLRLAAVNTGMSKYGEALTLSQRAVIAADRQKIVEMQIRGRLLMGMIYRHVGNTQEAVTVLKEASSLAEKRNGQAKFHVSMNLVAIFRDMGEYEEALEVLEGELRSCTEDATSLRWADCAFRMATILRRTGQYQIAESLLQKARQTFADSRLNLNVMECDGELAWLRMAEGQYEDAIRIFHAIKASDIPLMTKEFSWHCSRGIGFAYFQLGDFNESRNAYLEAVAVLEDMRHAVLYESSRISFLESKHGEYDKVIDCSLALRDYPTALAYIERLKSRNLAEMLRGRDVLPKGASQEERDAYRRLRLEVRLCEHTLKEEQRETGLGRSWEPLDVAKKRLQEFVVRLQDKDPSFYPDQVEPITAGQIVKLVEDTESAIIELYPMEDKTAAFVIRSDRKIDESTVVISHYNLESASKDVEAVRDRGQLESTLQRLYERLFVPLAPLLDGIKKIVFIPYGRLHLLPLHAMFTETEGGRKYLMDDRLVTYAPSAKVLKYCRERVRPHQDKAFVAAGPSEDLPNAGQEAKAVAELLGVKEKQRATRKDIINGTQDAYIFHYAGHSDGNALRLYAAVVGTDEDFYATGDIFVSQDMPNAWLATLSACETGKIQSGMADEYIGLPSAFLYAGSATVICSLWRVSDASTMLLMSKMYRLMIRDKKGKAESLREAQRWLRNPKNREEHLQELEKLLPWLRPAAGKPMPDAPRFGRTRLSAEKLLPEDLSHPYYWAGFICTGAP